MKRGHYRTALFDWFHSPKTRFFWLTAWTLLAMGALAMYWYIGAEALLLVLFVFLIQHLIHHRQTRQHLQLQETALQATANAIVITDKIGRIEWANPAFTASTGYTLAEVIGKNPRILNAGQQDAAFYRQLWETILAGQVWQGVFINRRKDGQLVHEEATITPVYNERGTIGHFIAVKQDVTERVVTEQALQEAKSRAEAASQAKSDFLATMSHEIRTPLNAVLGVLELLKASTLEPIHQEQVMLALGSGKMLLHLINDILDYSRMEADQLTLDCVPFNLRTLLDDIALNMSLSAHTKQVELTSFIPQELPVLVCGDPNRLTQILINLIGNAIKFTPPGGVVEFHGGPISREEGWLEFLFEIRDTGIGIPVTERAHIFERFVQANAATTRQYGGTGLGLAICQRLVQLMNGSIGVDGNPFAPSGSIFHFTVQLQEQAQPPVDVRQNILDGLRVMIVGSQGLLLAMLHNALNSWGVYTEDREEWQPALATLEQAVQEANPYQVVIINQWPGDNRLPTWTAWHDTHPGPCFLLLIDRLDQGMDQAVALPGDTICLKKPFRTDQLHSALLTLLQLDDGSHPQTAPPVPAHTPIPMASLLVVDDQSANLTVTLGLLAKAGCDRSRCITAMDGQQAVEAFQQGTFDLVFMDVQMPVMGGDEATRRIRAWEQQQGREPVPIIAFTADITPENRQVGHTAGMTDFLRKPVSLEDFQRVLQHYLSASTRAAPIASTERTLPHKTRDIASVITALQAVGFEAEDGRQVARLILEQWPELINKLEEALREADHEQVQALAHVLRGSLVHLLFPDMQKSTRRLHEAVRRQQWEEAERQLAQVRSRFAPIQAVLVDWLGQSEGSKG